MDLGFTSVSENATTGKLRRSCESCRSAKAKCYRSSATSNICDRCAQEGKDCVFLKAKARSRDSRGRRTWVSVGAIGGVLLISPPNRKVAEIEQRLDGLLTLLAHKEASREEYMLPVHETTALSSLPILGDANFASTELFESPSRIHFDSFTSPSPLLGLPFPIMDDFNDIISKGIVHFSHAERCVQYFREQSFNFPFVIVPETWSINFLRSRRPLLFQCILCVATRLDTTLQRKLELEVRESLSRKIILNCEKSLDVIQSILVYLTW